MSIQLDEFTKGYVLAAFWTFDDEAPSGDYEQSGRFEVLFPKLDPEGLRKMADDCARFQEQFKSELALTGGGKSQNGHDFWLTRNGHGSGFWSREGRDDILDKLTKGCHEFGEQDIYTGDDGEIYVYP